jgi:hypothetical protein
MNIKFLKKYVFKDFDNLILKILMFIYYLFIINL